MYYDTDSINNTWYITMPRAALYNTIITLLPLRCYNSGSSYTTVVVVEVQQQAVVCSTTTVVAPQSSTTTTDCSSIIRQADISHPTGVPWIFKNIPGTIAVPVKVQQTTDHIISSQAPRVDIHLLSLPHRAKTKINALCSQ